MVLPIIMVGAKDENHSMARFTSLDKNIVQPTSLLKELTTLRNMLKEREVKSCPLKQ